MRHDVRAPCDLEGGAGHSTVSQALGCALHGAGRRRGGHHPTRTPRSSVRMETVTQTPLKRLNTVALPQIQAADSSSWMLSRCASAAPMPSTATGRQDTAVVICHGADVIPAASIR